MEPGFIHWIYAWVNTRYLRDLTYFWCHFTDFKTRSHQVSQSWGKQIDRFISAWLGLRRGVHDMSSSECSRRTSLAWDCRSWFLDAAFTTLVLPKPRIKNRFCGNCSVLCVDYSCMMTTQPGDCTGDQGISVIRTPHPHCSPSYSGFMV